MPVITQKKYNLLNTLIEKNTTKLGILVPIKTDDINEYRKIYNREYYQIKKEYHTEYHKRKTHCDICNCDVATPVYKNHLKTKKHLKYLDRLENPISEEEQEKERIKRQYAKEYTKLHKEKLNKYAKEYRERKDKEIEI
jgi:hypothetical protein